jgi:hypothetical protein
MCQLLPRADAAANLCMSSIPDNQQWLPCTPGASGDEAKVRLQSNYCLGICRELNSAADPISRKH